MSHVVNRVGLETGTKRKRKKMEVAISYQLVLNSLFTTTVPRPKTCAHKTAADNMAVEKPGA
jgi:hypothetical protein